MELPKIKVADFEGPFDLLLHLIKKNKMDINNVELYKVTNQYLNYLDRMKEMDLEITSEFIIVAATLIEIKSKSLLPKVKKEEILDEEDLEKNLLEKLILYKKIKYSTEYFKRKTEDIGLSYSKKPEIIEEKEEELINNDSIFKNISLITLYTTYNNLLEKSWNKKNKTNIIQRNIKVDKYKIEDKYDYLLNRLKLEKINDFNDLMYECESKLEYVVTFLALLELMKERKIKVYQKENFNKIVVEGYDK